MFGKKDKDLLPASEDHRSCRFSGCAARVPDDITDPKEVTLWKNFHCYNEHYWELDMITRFGLKHTVGLGIEPPRPET